MGDAPLHEEASALHPAPAVTESKLRRLRILAADRNPRIRESVTSCLDAPLDVARGWLGPNPSTLRDVRASFATDPSPTPIALIAGAGVSPESDDSLSITLDSVKIPPVSGHVRQIPCHRIRARNRFPDYPFGGLVA